MATKIERIQAKAKRQLDKIIPFDQWVELRERTEEEKKIYKQTVEPYKIFWMVKMKFTIPS